MSAAGGTARPGPIAAWIDAVAPAMNDDGLDLLARAEPEPPGEGYAEETFFDPEGIGCVYGQDGWGWYADADRATAIVRMLNYDEGFGGRARAYDRGGRGKVTAGPRPNGRRRSSRASCTAPARIRSTAPGCSRRYRR